MLRLSELNSITIKNAFSLPRIDEILDLLSDTEIFSVLDATSGYLKLLQKRNIYVKRRFHVVKDYLNILECRLDCAMPLQLFKN